ncbi:MAG: hypothetical protein HKN79_00980, partial [Flavobacteriales bacterium]|nr:hypothetical protein [Flavobacteriales bacterium]
MRLLSTFIFCLFIGSFAAQSEPGIPASGEQLVPQQLSDRRLSPKEDLQFNAVETPAHPFFSLKADQGASEALRSPSETNKLSAIQPQTSLQVPSAEIATVLQPKKSDRSEMRSGDCLATGLTAVDGGCSDEGQGLLPVISLTFDIAGTCDVEDLCWGVNGETPTCVNLPANGFNIGDGEGINLINTTEDALYEIYFTTISGASGTIFYQNGNCIPQCLPISVTAEDLGCSDEG